MARTGTFGGFSFDPEVFSTMMQEADYWSNPILASGVIRNDANIMGLIGEKGNVATLPFYLPLNAFDEDMAALNNDGETDNTPVDVAGGKQTCMLIQRMKAFKAKDFTCELTGEDPIDNVKKKLASYYTQVWENELMNILSAVMDTEEMASHVTDLSVVSGTISDENLMNETSLIDAEQTALGDMAGGLGLIIMHSKVFANYKKLQRVEYDRWNGNSLRSEVSLPTIDGKHVLVCDRYTLDSSVPGFPVYKTYMVGQGAFLGADKRNYKEPYFVEYDPEASAGTEFLYTKQGKVLHPNGFSLAADEITGESPTTAELANPDNWTLRFHHKNILMGLIKSNG